MTILQYAYRQSIYELDSQATASAKLVYTFPGGTIKSITRTLDGKLFFLGRTDPVVADHRKIYQLALSTGQSDATLVYEHPFQIHNLEQRLVGGSPRLYFSASMTEVSGSKQAIYFLGASHNPVLYCEADDYFLPIPDPCNEGEFNGGWRGHFAFDGGDALYLSTGNVVPAGLYRINGAGSASVSGVPVRIYLKMDGGIWGFACASDTEIFFHRSLQICRLDLTGTPTEAVVADNLGDMYNSIADVACTPVSPAWQAIPIWVFFKRISRFPWLQPKGAYTGLRSQVERLCHGLVTR